MQSQELSELCGSFSHPGPQPTEEAAAFSSWVRPALVSQFVYWMASSVIMAGAKLRGSLALLLYVGFPQYTNTMAINKIRNKNKVYKPVQI